MKIEIASLTGKRKQNEDKHNIIKNIDGRDPNMAKLNYYGVYDGHGGKFVSQFLSENFYKFFMDKRTEYPLKKRDVSRTYKFFQDLLRTKYKNNATNCGSTCLIVLHYIKDGKERLNVLNLGDCRCIIASNDNRAIPLTKDHKPDKPEEEHRIKQLGGNIEFDGYDYRISDLSVSRAFGDLSAEPYIGIEPDMFEYTIGPQDKFMILACDGLWDVMDNQEAVDFVLKTCYDMNTNIKVNEKINMAKRLADRAIEKGSGDNISVIVVFF